MPLPNRTGGATDARGLDLVATDGGTRLRLRVKPGARKGAILGPHAGALKVSVTAAPERGKANRAVLELLGRALDLSPSSMSLVSGAASPDKVVWVPLRPADLKTRLKKSV